MSTMRIRRWLGLAAVAAAALTFAASAAQAQQGSYGESLWGPPIYQNSSPPVYYSPGQVAIQPGAPISAPSSSGYATSPGVVSGYSGGTATAGTLALPSGAALTQSTPSMTYGSNYYRPQSAGTGYANGQRLGTSAVPTQHFSYGSNYYRPQYSGYANGQRLGTHAAPTQHFSYGSNYYHPQANHWGGAMSHASHFRHGR
jgi:hypothetical protein